MHGDMGCANSDADTGHKTPGTTVPVLLGVFAIYRKLLHSGDSVVSHFQHKPSFVAYPRMV